nr:MAG TPA: hypothetical protein [Caudoviricetes sp.]
MPVTCRVFSAGKKRRLFLRGSLRWSLLFAVARLPAVRPPCWRCAARGGVVRTAGLRSPAVL